ncbi:hypothetical protein DH2020_002523 [Rehmannia glutinosa]|uniref:Uncharacterized protein n=1 Tax=Rehmannia glutinosa TaxID=99300 RepID=A0ABR0XTZ9_REHGL
MRFSALRRGAVDAVKNYFRRDWDAEALLNMDHIPPFISRHLKKMYFSLLCVSTSSSLGSYFTGNIGNLFAVLGAFMSIVFFYFVAPWKEKKRLCLLSVGAFFGGATVAPWFTLFLSVDAGFIVTSLLATSVGFGCYWASSKSTDRVDLLYFRAMLLYSPLVLICLLISSSVFGGDSAYWKYQLYVLLLWYMVYLAVYSQEVVLKARRGDSDYVKHAISFFTHFPAVVIHSGPLFWPLMNALGRAARAIGDYSQILLLSKTYTKFILASLK